MLGAGQIGCCVAHLLASVGNYQIILADINTSEIVKQVSQHKNISFHNLDINDQQQTLRFCQEQNAVAICCCLPFTFNLAVAKIAVKLKMHYFDLTEDRLSAQAIQALETSPKQVMISQCGLAPGLVNLLVNHYVNDFKKIFQRYYYTYQFKVANTHLKVNLRLSLRRIFYTTVFNVRLSYCWRWFVWGCVCA